ncbi:MAG TPA: hypothetical protein VGQ03_09610 [Nitrososphaera sp.]|nr:hypothetical protein [Nitrososphaera sp.]
MKKAGRVRDGMSGTPSKSKVVIVGGVAACALAIAVIATYMNFGASPQEFTPSPNVPSASGSNVNSAAAVDPSVEPTESTTDPANLDPDYSGVHSGAGEEVQSPVQVHFTDDNFELLRSSPNDYVNSTAEISGRVYELVDQSSGGYILITYRIHNQAIDSEESRAVAMFQQVGRTGTIPPDVSVDDCISIQGRVRGGIGDTNSLGQPIEIPIIDLNSVKEVECIDSAMPAVQTISANLSQSYAGVVLTAEKVQISDGHLRIKISAKNIDVGDSVFIREKDSQAEYQGKIYPSLNIPIFSVYKIDSVVPANSEVTGYLFFEPIEEFTGDPIVFRIVVEKAGIAESEKSTFILKI